MNDNAQDNCNIVSNLNNIHHNTRKRPKGVKLKHNGHNMHKKHNMQLGIINHLGEIWNPGRWGLDLIISMETCCSR